MVVAAKDDLGDLPDAFLAIVRRHALPEQLKAFHGRLARYLLPGAPELVPAERRSETLFNLLAADFSGAQIAAMWRDWEEHRVLVASRKPMPVPAVAETTSGGPLALALGTVVLGGLALTRGRRR